MSVLPVGVTREELGWSNFFQQQCVGEDESLHACRVVGVQRTGLKAAPGLDGPGIDVTVGGRWFQGEPADRPTIGDWILVDRASAALQSVLERRSLIKRMSPGGDIQLIAANIDTAFVVMSCNQDFNLNRLERYFSVVLESGIQPVAVLTKADLADDVYEYVDAVRSVSADMMVEAVDARSAESVAVLEPWCGQRQTVALLGSSGVGKSTLVNTLSGAEVQLTSGIREDDDKGRHTTTDRSLHLLPQGGVILDSPGMRELQVAEADRGVSSVFADIDELALRCRFNDCGHESEPGCAVREAIESGELDERRLQSYFKLQREELRNTETIAERHARSRQFAKMVKQHIKKR